MRRKEGEREMKRRIRRERIEKITVSEEKGGGMRRKEEDGENREGMKR